jgi:hypothetical protein
LAQLHALGAALFPAAGKALVGRGLQRRALRQRCRALRGNERVSRRDLVGLVRRGLEFARFEQTYADGVQAGNDRMQFSGWFIF